MESTPMSLRQRYNLSTFCREEQILPAYLNDLSTQFPVTRDQGVGRCQVSWSMEHKLSCSGTYEEKFFNEESYSILCNKAQQNNKDASEVLAAFLGLLVYYMAFSAKSNFQA
uniref:Translocon-associated protein subunit delta n=1 Tax=Podarcis muralis TaxID=64176 RepID=A0A670J364_PODMU